MRCPACDHDNIPGVDLCAGCGLDLAGLDVEAWGVDPDDPLLVAPLSGLPLKTPIVFAPGDTAAAAVERMIRDVKVRERAAAEIEELKKSGRWNG